MRKYEMKRTEKKSEEPNVRATMNVPDVKVEVKKTPAKAPLKTRAADLSTAGTNIATLAADYGVGPVQVSSYTAMQLKAANRAINRMKGQKQGT
jgi:hypothetical protein